MTLSTRSYLDSQSKSCKRKLEDSSSDDSDSDNPPSSTKRPKLAINTGKSAVAKPSIPSDSSISSSDSESASSSASDPAQSSKKPSVYTSKGANDLVSAAQVPLSESEDSDNSGLNNLSKHSSNRRCTIIYRGRVRCSFRS